MNPRGSFARKLLYLVLMAALLVPMHWLARPAVIDPVQASSDPGGVLAQLRDRYQLSQSSLGEVDPASETLKLATLGMRGVAANLLFAKANEFKMKKDWTNVSATLEQLARLQPNFVSAWRFQAWNLSYNCSAEFDDYRERYRWVIKGIDYLKEGIRYNAREPILQWDLGWFHGQKIGRSDEQKQFRRLFKQDPEIHGNRPLEQRDNWLVAREWFFEAERLVDTQGAVMRGQSPLIYRSDAPMCLINYAEANQREGMFGEAARRAWRRAADDWQRFGQIDIPTAFDRQVRLGEKEAFQQRAKRLQAELDQLQPGLRARLQEEKRDRLTDAQREALAMDSDKRTAQQERVADEARQAIEVTHREVARRVPAELRRRAEELAEQVSQAEEMVMIIGHQREIVNYDNWRTRVQLEQEDSTLSARELMYRGDAAFEESLSDLTAREMYEKSFAAWRKVLDQYPSAASERTLTDDVIEAIRRYRRVLSRLGESFPKDFVLADIVKLHENK